MSKVSLKCRFDDRKQRNLLLGAPFGRGPLVFELRCPKLRYATAMQLQKADAVKIYQVHFRLLRFQFFYEMFVPASAQANSEIL